jgi:hypothetical protein
MRETGRIRGTLHVHRTPKEAPFEPSDVKMLELIVAFVAHGMTRAVVGEEAFANSDGDSALFITYRDGRVHYAGAQAQQLLMMALNPCFSRTPGWRSLREPIPEIAQLCHSLSAAAEGEVEQLPRGPADTKPLGRVRPPCLLVRADRWRRADPRDRHYH